MNRLLVCLGAAATLVGAWRLCRYLRQYPAEVQA